jgi:hypothetical protein
MTPMPEASERRRKAAYRGFQAMRLGAFDYQAVLHLESTI